MCQFKIVPLEEQQYDVIIFSESYDSPFEYSILTPIQKKLLRKGATI